MMQQRIHPAQNAIEGVDSPPSDARRSDWINTRHVMATCPMPRRIAPPEGTLSIPELLAAWRATERRWERQAPDDEVHVAAHEVVAAFVAYQDAALRPQTGEFMLIVDEDQAYVGATRDVTTVLGYQPEELIGRRFGDLATPDELGATPGQWRTFVGKGRQEVPLTDMLHSVTSDDEPWLRGSSPALTGGAHRSTRSHCPWAVKAMTAAVRWLQTRLRPALWGADRHGDGEPCASPSWRPSPVGDIDPAGTGARHWQAPGPPDAAPL